MAIIRSLAPLVPIIVAMAGLVACGSDGDAPADLGLSAAGAAGQQIALEKGCGSCHGVSGEGGVAPAFQGLIGRTVELRDGETVVADEAYVIESILDPNAKRVEGYSIPMPEVNLTDEELASIVAYINELADLPAPAEAP